MKTAELKSKITKMEAGLDNPNIQGAARDALVKALANAREELAKLEAEAKKTAQPAVKPKAKPKSSTTKPSAFSWKKKADLSNFSPITLHCQHYHLPVTEDTRVSLKKTGNTSVVVTAKPGDHIIFDDEGYAVFVMEGRSFKKKCTKKQGASEDAEKKSVSTQTRKKATPKAKRPTKKRVTATQTKKRSSKTATKSTKPSAYMTTIDAFNKEVESIRTTYKKPGTDPDKLKKELIELAEKSDQKNYLQFVERKIKRLKTDKVRATKAEIVRIGIAIRPLVQSIRGTVRDANTDNRKVLEPSLDNLIRWAKSPGQYDLAGVDASVEKPPTVKAKVKQREKAGFLEWLFGV